MDINHIFNNAKQAWMNKIDSLTYEELLKDNTLSELLLLIDAEAQAFKDISPIAHYFDPITPEETKVSEPTAPVTALAPASKSPEYPDSYYRFKRLVRGGELINLNNESLHMDQVYVPENAVRDFGLVTGDVVEATITENIPGKYTNTITTIVERAEPHEETAPFTIYPHLIVDRDGFGQLYAARYAVGGYAKNEDGDMLNFRISPNDERRYVIEKGSLVDISVDNQSGYSCVAFKHKQEQLTDNSSRTKKVKKADSVQTTDQEESNFLDSIDYDLKQFEGKTLVLMSGEHLVSRYEEVFSDGLGMNLLQFNTDNEVNQMTQSIRTGVDYAIACPSVVSHDATESFKATAKKTNVDFIFSKYDGPKQVLLKLIELDQRIKARAV